MPKALFVSNNLIGDGLCISRALRQWHADHPDFDIDLLTLADHTTCIYTRMGVPVNVVTDEALASRMDYDFRHTFDPSAAFPVCDRYRCHLIEGYAIKLAVDITSVPYPERLNSVFIPTPEELTPQEKDLILVSMFSASCSSRDKHRTLPPNKMLPWPKWERIIEFLAKIGPIRFLGAPTDRADGLVIPSEYYMTGIPLNKLALMMKKAKLVVTIDNGMSHLAGSQLANQVLLYPVCLGLHYVVPYGNPNLAVIQMNPATVSADSIYESVVKATNAVLSRGGK